MRLTDRRALHRVLNISLLLLLLGFLGYRLWPQVAAALADGAGSGAAPEFELRTLDGDLLSLESLRGRVVRVGIARPKKYPAPMPPMGGARLRAAEIEAVARYVLSLNPTTAPKGGQR